MMSIQDVLDRTRYNTYSNNTVEKGTEPVALQTADRGIIDASHHVVTSDTTLSQPYFVKYSDRVGLFIPTILDNVIDLTTCSTTRTEVVNVRTNRTGGDRQKKQLMADGGDPTDDMKLFTSSETDEWATPPEFLRPLAEAVGGFDLDAAAGAEESPIAECVYTEDDDGLTQSWFGTVWVNPPYSDMEKWTEKVISELQRDDVDTILYLCKGDTSTNWWHAAVTEASAVGMIDSRLSFGEGSNSAPFASHVFVFGDVNNTVLDTLNRRGTVFTTDHLHENTAQTKLVDDK